MVHKWSNDRSDGVIFVIVATISLIVDGHVVQDDVSPYDQSDSALRVRSVRDG
jgi:hypothetical protein